MDNTNSSRLNPKVFSMAANLFGIPEPQSTEPRPLPSEINSDPDRIMAVYPSITGEAFTKTMDNYRIFVATYNFTAKAENALLEQYNNTVQKNWASGNLTEVQIKFAQLFRKNHGHDYNRVWNEKAEAFNQEYGMLIEKKKIQTIKPQTELIFQNFLFLYNRQLMKRNEQQMRLRLNAVRPLQEFKVNPYHITELKRNQVASIDLCTKTIRNHRERLQEVGILMDYNYTNPFRPVALHINPKILVIFDINSKKLTTSENQHVTPVNGKELPHTYYENTRTIKNECEIKENASDFPDKEFAPLTTNSFVFYKNTAGKDDNSPMPPAPADVKISETLPQLSSPAGRFAAPTTAGTVAARFIPVATAGQDKPDCTRSETPKTKSEILQELIVDPQQLAVELAQQKHFGYVPIDLRHFEREAFTGTMTQEDFRQLVIQDFFKSAAKLYRETSPWAGSWKKAINLYYERKFVRWNGNSFNKADILQDIPELRWRLENVRKYQLRNPDWQLLFPNQYFDFSRDSAKEGGFEYTVKAWKSHLSYMAGKEARKRRTEAEAERRKRKINHAKKCENEIKRFFKNKISIEQLHDYVHNNLPDEFKLKLPEMMERIKLNLK